MPIKKSSIKDVRRTRKRRERNVAVISRLRSAIAGVGKAATKEEAQKAYRTASSLLDKAAQKNYIHRGNASRNKARLAALVAGKK